SLIQADTCLPTLVWNFSLTAKLSLSFMTMFRIPRSTLFPYTTLFRSTRCLEARHGSIRWKARGLRARGRRFCQQEFEHGAILAPDRKSTRLNSSHVEISYAVFCL